jgi:hypothetical protein
MAVPGAPSLAGPAAPGMDPALVTGYQAPGVGPRGPAAPPAPLPSTLGNGTFNGYPSNGESLSGGGAVPLRQGTRSYEPGEMTGPSHMTDAMATYVAQFQRSQAAQQQAINAGLVQALGGLGQRRDAASKVVATLPGEFDKAYLQATANQHEQAKLTAPPTSPVPLSERAAAAERANQASITAGNTQAQAAGHANQPLLEAGIAADYSKGATTLDNTKMQNQAALSDEATQFAMQQYRDQFQADQSRQAAGEAYMRDVAGQKTAHDYRMEEAAFSSSLGGTPKDNAPASGFIGLTNGDVSAVTQSPDYQNNVANLTKMINPAGGGLKPGDSGYYGPTTKGQSVAQWIAEMNPTNPALVQVLAQQFGKALAYIPVP